MAAWPDHDQSQRDGALHRLPTVPSGVQEHHPRDHGPQDARDNESGSTAGDPDTKVSVPAPAGSGGASSEAHWTRSAPPWRPGDPTGYPGAAARDGDSAASVPAPAADARSADATADIAGPTAAADTDV